VAAVGTYAARVRLLIGSVDAATGSEPLGSTLHLKQVRGTI